MTRVSTRGPGPGSGRAFEVDELREHEPDFPRRRRARFETAFFEPEVEARSGVEALGGDLALLVGRQLARLRAGAAVLAFAVAPQLVELALHAPAAVGVTLVPDPLLEVLLAPRLAFLGHVDVAGVVAEDTVAAAAELELDVLLLDPDGGDHDPVAGLERHAELADAGAVGAEVDGRLAIGIEVDAALRRRHVHLDDDELPFEGLLQVPLGLGVGGRRGGREDDSNDRSNESAHAQASGERERKARPCGGRTAATGRARHDQDHRIHVSDTGSAGINSSAGRSTPPDPRPPARRRWAAQSVPAAR